MTALVRYDGLADPQPRRLSLMRRGSCAAPSVKNCGAIDATRARARLVEQIDKQLSACVCFAPALDPTSDCSKSSG